ncbi:MAG: hypothetical protein UU88_C0001G0057 [Parcubacteria group bacterium GW2011_GWC1_42_11]|uniref:Uncharacterized protein n=1 Tax=Candidatus Nomurabacteria bacterium GW2011_GWC2_42_20 TaxID=1618756 RepID=A0A0G1CDE0_9BACT|nr:MAG: hypothetical protein UU88_C0001G0057 [Parcubacteria group bacterium GW2011_GWC1_42_11]KKS47638.1 MAG: hypothetical protein UV12_C0006G0062 [Candidatus Nomurabacteria bacterium GW2011_GWC2_42_20]KKS58434.1 MAG: hypothetical protein UV24_C0023G0018 [Candidatus Nomurabacteria bacterium GW2011_GWA2_42_41]KKT09238.1 MAG: hypothetical protein UV86_C0011G0022 [Candidatus Nomurabacteria bacterium GW2011_GWB1_43_20]TAN36870.1 MAG: hypothetical protein EPN27_00525 [Patescibacteria group bacterium
MEKILNDALDYIINILVLIVLALVSVVIYLFFITEDLRQKLWRELIILVFGYGGDIVDAVSAGVRGLFDPDYAREVLNC